VTGQAFGEETVSRTQVFEWPWQATQSVPYTTVTFYADCVKICEDFGPSFGDKRTGCCITTMHCLTLPLSPGNFFLLKPIDCRPPLNLLFAVSLIEDKTERHTVEVTDRTVGGAEQPHRTRLPRCVYRMAEGLGMVHM
jgi:hypothetical protein